MKVIVAGSRDFEDAAVILRAIQDSGFTITELVNGMCPTGVDKVAKAMADSYGVPVEPFPADWAKHGRAAGPIRNAEMAAYADACVVIYDGESRGSQSMIDEATKANIPCHVHVFG